MNIYQYSSNEDQKSNIIASHVPHVAYIFELHQLKEVFGKRLGLLIYFSLFLTQNDHTVLVQQIWEQNSNR